MGLDFIGRALDETALHLGEGAGTLGHLGLGALGGLLERAILLGGLLAEFLGLGGGKHRVLRVLKGLVALAGHTLEFPAEGVTFLGVIGEGGLKGLLVVGRVGVVGEHALHVHHGDGLSEEGAGEGEGESQEGGFHGVLSISQYRSRR